MGKVQVMTDLQRSFTSHSLANWATIIERFNCSFLKGELSASQKQAVITLIQKKDRDVTLIKNWGPISLINIDSKIASKALPARMKQVIHSLISYDQTAYVKGRYIGESVRLIDNFLKDAEVKILMDTVCSSY